MFARTSSQVPNLLKVVHRMSSTSQAGKLAGKVAVVTASTDGIGLAIATHLAKDGAQVVVSSRKEANVAKTVEQLKQQGLSVFGIPCHVGIAADREKLIQGTVEKYGGIDILVSNAAVNPVFGPILDCSEEAWDKIFDVNVKAPFLLTKAVVPIMEKRNGGSIIFISSIGGYQALPALGPYCVSKTALLGLTKALATQCAGSNIRVNCVAPGVIQTKFSGALVDDDAVREKVLEQIPIGRIGQPRDIGGIVSFLASEDSAYVTGESFVVAGGMYSRL